MSRTFGLIERARYERKRTIDPRHEELPHGDWPHLDVAPLEDLDRDANSDFIRLLLGALGIAAVVVIAMAVFILIWLAGMLIAWPAHATYKPEYGAHSDALKKWFQDAKLTPEAHARIGWIGCCQSSERVRAKFRLTVDGDGWEYECTKLTRAACRDIADGDWKNIAPDVIHHEPIMVPKPYDENDPQIKAEFTQLRTEGVLFIAWGQESCFWPPQSGQ